MTNSLTNVDLANFPHKQNINFMAYCSVSPLNKPAADRATYFMERQKQVGRGMLFEYTGDENIANRFHKNFGQLFKTSADNITMVTNTSEALSMMANGYPFESGDQIISYVNEYPANHYPWVLQAKHRGVELIQLKDADVVQEARPYTDAIPESMARGWSFEELESTVTDRTRVIAISHVQFTSGYAADLAKLGDFCKSKNIDLIVDAAQGIGCLPIYPEEYGIACVAAAGWKWLLGPVGSAVMYTSPEFRAKIEITMSGADHMKQDTEYLDHTWAPFENGRKFEYSTVAYSVLDALSVGLEEIFLPHSMEAIRDSNFAKQELALEHLNFDKYQPVVHVLEHRSGILAIIPKVASAKQISGELDKQNIIITPRDGYLRFAPHLCTTEDEIMQAVEALNAID
jgi:selenocysteine lyase/cysteine desulfurase